MIFWLSAELISAYVYSTSAFLLLRTFNREVKEKTPGFLQRTNWLIAAILFLNLLLVLVKAWQCSSCYGFAYYSSIISASFASFLSLIFLFRKFRAKISLTIIAIILLLAYLKSDLLRILVTTYFEDRRSSWSIYYRNTNEWWTIGFCIIWFCICYLGAGPRKNISERATTNV
jgi:hypothetical protein